MTLEVIRNGNRYQRCHTIGIILEWLPLPRTRA
jgi:hypothetical protein